MRQIIVIFLLSFSFIFVQSQRIQRSNKGLYGLAVPKTNGNVKWIAKPVYTTIKNHINGTFIVRSSDGLWGIISSTGKPVVDCKYTTSEYAKEAYKHLINPASKDYASNIQSRVTNSSYPDFTLARDYSTYIKNYVENKVNLWQRKDEFEKTSAYQVRVTEKTRNEMIAKSTQEACEECLTRVSDKELRMRLGEYDADNESFIIITEIGDIIVPVSITKAKDFKKNWSNIISKNTYDIVNGRIVLCSAIFELGGKVQATYNNQNQTLYAQTNVEFNFDPIIIPQQNNRPTNQSTISNITIQVGKSDVDTNIPTGKSSDPNNTVAVIIANESYNKEANVPFAANDGKVFAEYCRQTFGLPETNVHLITNATLNDMRHDINWLKQVIETRNGKAKVIFYYAGHGIPNEATKSAYLLPVDGYGSDITTGYALEDLYKELGSSPAESVTIFLDACFSGAKREGDMLASARGIALKADRGEPIGNMVVFSAAQGDETAFPFKKEGHGLFTYYLLKKLQDTKGNVTLKDLGDYIKEQVSQQSIVVNNKPQTPSVLYSPAIADSWSGWKLK